MWPSNNFVILFPKSYILGLLFYCWCLITADDICTCNNIGLLIHCILDSSFSLNDWFLIGSFDERWLGPVLSRVLCWVPGRNWERGRTNPTPSQEAEASRWEQEGRHPDALGSMLWAWEDQGQSSARSCEFCHAPLPLWVCFLIHNQGESLTPHKAWMSLHVSERIVLSA